MDRNMALGQHRKCRDSAGRYEHMVVQCEELCFGVLGSLAQDLQNKSGVVETNSFVKFNDKMPPR